MMYTDHMVLHLYADFAMNNICVHHFQMWHSFKINPSSVNVEHDTPHQCIGILLLTKHLNLLRPGIRYCTSFESKVSLV